MLEKQQSPIQAPKFHILPALFRPGHGCREKRRRKPAFFFRRSVFFINSSAFSLIQGIKKAPSGVIFSEYLRFSPKMK